MASIFSKIIAGTIPSRVVHHDDTCTVILDIEPLLPGHCLVIANREVSSISQLTTAELTGIMENVQKLGNVMREKLGATAINVLENDGPDAGQAVPHVHFHVIPRHPGQGNAKDLTKKPYPSDEEADKYLNLLKY